jgi:serine/threonine protein phosphatase 1
MKKGRIFTLGDIHARFKALRQVFTRAHFDFDHDICIFVGDIVDRGEEPYECMEFMYHLKNKVLIQGNHDINFHGYIRNGQDFLAGKHGVAITKQKWNYEIKYDEIKKNIVHSYFESMVPYHIDIKNRIFTHGGFDNLQPIEDQIAFEFAWNRNLWEEAIKCSSEQKIPTVDCFTEIYIGHTPTIRYGAKEEITMAGIILNVGEPITTPMYMGGVWNMDTGAGFDEGKLTMMNIDTKEIFQSDLIKDLYGTK